MKEISVFGEEARNIQEGQIFKAVKVPIDMEDKVILVPVYTIDSDGVPSYEVRFE